MLWNQWKTTQGEKIPGKNPRGVNVKIVSNFLVPQPPLYHLNDAKRLRYNLACAVYQEKNNN